MKRILIIYHSQHHMNTERLLLSACKGLEIACVKCSKFTAESLHEVDCVGFASGIFYSKHHKTILKLVDSQKSALQGKQAFVIYTAGAMKADYERTLTEQLESYGIPVIGQFSCLAWDSFGPLALVGGIHKDRPNDTDVENLRKFLLEMQGKE